jgi:hypothetical protein
MAMSEDVGEGKMGDKEVKQTPQEIIARLHAMTRAEFNDFMHNHFLRICSKPLQDDIDSRKE